jgi:hypothetical protein
MSFNTNITPGRPPLLWSEVQEAFVKVNENFDILVATVGGGSGLTPINFETLDTSVSPTLDNLYKLGDITHRWRAVHTGEFTLGDLDNGVWLGNAQIKGIGSTVNLPANSTIGGDPLTGIGTSLIIDPEKTFFKTIEVDNNLSVVATTFGDTLNLLSGSGISLSVNSASDSIEIDNTGILSVSAGDGMTVATVSGASTVTNAGVRSLQSTTALPTGRTTGAGININGSTGDNLRITNTGVITVTAGLGITVSVDVATGEYQITNSAPVVNSFAVVQINGDAANRLIADSVSDVLNVNSAYPILLSKTPGTDTFEISLNPAHDIKGSVFADDSTLMVDAVSGIIPAAVVSGTFTGSMVGNVTGNVTGNLKGSVFADDSTQIIDGNSFTVYGNIEATTLRTSDLEIALGGNVKTGQGFRAVAVGADAGLVNQGTRTVAIGNQAGELRQSNYGVAIGASAAYFEQGDSAVAIGDNAGQSSQGDYAIAVGHYAGHNNQSANSIILNASGAILNGAAAGFFVNPIRSTANGRPLMYDTSTKELFSSNVLEFIGSRISTSDSSGITIDVQTTFNTDVTFENDITVAERLTVKGSRVINLTELQSVVAASASFADFQTRIAALA